MENSFGLLEVKGVAAAYYALDMMLKNTSVEYAADEKNLGAGLVTVIIKGNIAAVTNAIEFGKREAEKVNKVLTAASISNPDQELASFILRNNPSYINKNTINVDKEEDKVKKAIGFVEIYGYATSLITADTALKSSNVSLLGLDKTKGLADTPGLIMFLKIAGNLDDVSMAVEAAVNISKKYAGVVSHTVLAQPDSMIKTLIKKGI